MKTKRKIIVMKFGGSSVGNVDKIRSVAERVIRAKDDGNDVVVVVESKDKASDADGVYRIFGLEFGLYPSTDTVRANDASGARNIELTSLSGQEETQSQYNFDTGTNAQTLAALVLLETPAV